MAQDESAKVRRKLLVIDDDDQILRQIRWALSEDFEVFTACTRDTALETFRREAVSLALLDLGLPPRPREASEGLQALDELLEINPLAKVIIVSGNSERQNAIRAVEKGAHDIFPKPLDLDQLKVVLHRAHRRLELERESIEERDIVRRVSFEEIIGSSSVMNSLYSTIGKVAQTDVPVLIVGESGTGKELVANAIHNRGARKKGPFVAINCSAIPEPLLESELFGHERGAFTGATAQRRGKLEYAHGGTLFLDEIGDLALSLQVKLLRFLQERVIERVGGRASIMVDSRVISATNQDLQAAVKGNQFREDLYFRLAVVKMQLPPLRDRSDDVIELAQHLLVSFSRELRKPPRRLSQAALQALCKYSWPGNVRELQNKIKRALVLAEGPVIGPAELELETHADLHHFSGSNLKVAREGLEKEIVSKTLRENNGNISRTARALGISRPTVYDLIARYGLQD